MNSQSISIITPTIGKNLLIIKRCIESVKKQDYDGKINHFIIGDHLDSAISNKIRSLCIDYEVNYHNDTRPLDTSYEPARTGRLRNLGVNLCQDSYIGHLDDDNTFKFNHISSLMEVLLDDIVDIAYSWRIMRNADGSKFPVFYYPWVIEKRKNVSKEVLLLLEKEGIFKEGSPIIKDLVPTSHGDLFHIDSSEWIMKREVFDRVKFLEIATPREMIYQYTEDYLFCRDAYNAGFIFRCSNKITLNYYRGGYH